MKQPVYKISVPETYIGGKTRTIGGERRNVGGIKQPGFVLFVRPLSVQDQLTIAETVQVETQGDFIRAATLEKMENFRAFFRGIGNPIRDNAARIASFDKLGSREFAALKDLYAQFHSIDLTPTDDDSGNSVTIETFEPEQEIRAE